MWPVKALAGGGKGLYHPSSVNDPPMAGAVELPGMAGTVEEPGTIEEPGMAGTVEEPGIAISDEEAARTSGGGSPPFAPETEHAIL